MANNDKDKQLAEQAAELEALRKKQAELEEQVAADASAAAKKDAEIDALKKMLEAAEKKNTAPATDSGVKPKTKTIRLYKDENICDDVQVFVNGRQYIIKRGVEVEVPMEVFEVLDNQQKMREHIANYNAKHASE